jgi:magnesium-transporting ATPase (P-type)
MISKPCHPEVADILILELDGQKYAPDVIHYKNLRSQEHAVVIEIDCVRYLASSRDGYQFDRVPEVPSNFARFLTVRYDEEQEQSLLEEERRILSLQYGSNMMLIPESSFAQVLLRQLLSPFFLFQYFAATIWYIEEYWLYATLIVVITLSAAYLNASETMFNLERLRQLAGAQSSVQLVSIAKNNKNLSRRPDKNEVSVHDMSLSSGPDSCLLPGTKFLVAEGMTLPCDAVLISGKVVVDESMLTGESIPVSKTPIDFVGLGGEQGSMDSSSSRSRAMLQSPSVLGKYVERQEQDPYEKEEKQSAIALMKPSTEKELDIASKRPGNVLFGGTKVRACYGEHCIAVAYRTGFRSAKGQLVASLLKPKDSFINFVSDAIGIIAMTTIAISFVYIFIALHLESLGVSHVEAFFYYLDAITIAVPPGLTACLTIATSVAIERLKRIDIYVSDTTRVNYGGIVTAACFDKTGTLTENSLQLVGVICTEAIHNNNPSMKTNEPKATGQTLNEYKAADNNVPVFCQEIMATCHSLSLEGYDASTARGDPLEEELLNASKWTLRLASNDRSGQLIAFPPTVSVHDNSQGYQVLKHFEFTPEKLRAASLVLEPSGRLVYLMKGSPEVIIGCSDPSTVPQDIQSSLTSLAKEGLRVIAIAFKNCSGSTRESLLSQTQDEIESHALDGNKIVFLGLMYLSSALKKDTRRTIHRLQRAKIHVNMITGDHIHTAISVGGSCGILRYKTTHAGADSKSGKHDVTGHASERVPRKLYIVDEDPVTEKVVIVDGATELAVHDFTLPELIYDAARSYVQDLTMSESSAVLFAEDLVESEEHDADIDLGGVFNPIRAMAQHFSHTHNDLHQVIASGEGNGNNQESKRVLVEIAVTGKGLHAVFRDFPEYTSLSLVRYTKIFARTKPYDKKYIVESLLKSNALQLIRMAKAEPSLDLRYDDFLTDNVSCHSLRMFNSSSALTSANVVDASLPTTLLENEDLNETMEVLFCGDGANDMIALRAATVGVSLCDAETSVAAPVTSKDQTPGSVVDVLKEGRCSLVTAYVLIIFNMNYAVIQLCLAFSMYYYGLKVGDYMYLIQDLFFAFFLGLAISYSGPTKSLSETLPPRRFLVPYIMSRLLLNIFTYVLFQMLALYVLSLQSFYSRYETDDPLNDTYSYETSSIFNLSLSQLLIAAIVSTIGKPFREAWYENRSLVYLMLVQAGYILFQIFGGDNYFLTNIIELEAMPTYYGFIQLAIIALHLVVCFAIRNFCEYFFTLKHRGVSNFQFFWKKPNLRPILSKVNISPSNISGNRVSTDSHVASETSSNEDNNDRKPLLRSALL